MKSYIYKSLTTLCSVLIVSSFIYVGHDVLNACYAFFNSTRGTGACSFRTVLQEKLSLM